MLLFRGIAGCYYEASETLSDEVNHGAIHQINDVTFSTFCRDVTRWLRDGADAGGSGLLSDRKADFVVEKGHRPNNPRGEGA